MNKLDMNSIEKNPTSKIGKKSYKPQYQLKRMTWVFHAYDDDFSPSVPHGHSGKYKLDIITGAIIDTTTGLEVASLDMKEMQRLRSDIKFQKLVTRAREYYLNNNPGSSLPDIAFISSKLNNINYPNNKRNLYINGLSRNVRVRRNLLTRRQCIQFNRDSNYIFKTTVNFSFKQNSYYNSRNPITYLKWEYERINSKRIDITKIDLDEYFELIKHNYRSDQVELYESDKILFKKLKEMASDLNLPIEEQDRRTYGLLNRHSQIVKNIAQENNILIPNEIILGTLPLQELNAFACDFENRQKLIVLNDGLFLFLYSMGRVISSFFSKVSTNKQKDYMTFDFNEKNILSNLKTNKQGHIKFVEALTLYFVYQNLSISNIYYEKDENLYLSGILWDTAELFVVAHEYSHIILDHLSPKKKTIKRFLDDESNLYEIKRNWTDEYLADELALQLTMAHNKKEGYGLFSCFIGIEFLFACLDIIEKTYNIQFSDTHPLAKMRIENLRKYLQKLLPQKADTILDGGKVINHLFTDLWESNKEIIFSKCRDLSN